MANVTLLGGVGRIDFDKLTTGAFSLVRKEAKELRPGRIQDRFGQAVVMHQAMGMNVLDTNQTVDIDDLARRLMIQT